MDIIEELKAARRGKRCICGFTTSGHEGVVHKLHCETWRQIYRDHRLAIAEYVVGSHLTLLSVANKLGLGASPLYRIMVDEGLLKPEEVPVAYRSKASQAPPPTPDLGRRMESAPVDFFVRLHQDKDAMRLAFNTYVVPLWEELFRLRQQLQVADAALKAQQEQNHILEGRLLAMVADQQAAMKPLDLVEQIKGSLQ